MVLPRLLLPILTLGLVLSACVDGKAKPGPAAEDETREVKVSPDLRDPFKKDEGAGETGEGAGETGEFDSVGGLAQVPTARCKGGVAEHEIPSAQDQAAEPAKGGKKPSPDLTDPFKK